MTTKQALYKQTMLMAKLQCRLSTACDWVETMKLNWRIAELEKNIEEIKATPEGGKISLISWVDIK